jgi:sirohydrochlorin cobaltochelatase
LKPHRIIGALETWLRAGDTRIGEIIILGHIGLNESFELRHHLDADADNLELFTGPEEARAIALYDATGEYRPLKTAPNLKRGWKLTLRNIPELHLALDYFYPAALAARLAIEERRLAITPLRDTLNRQSGMYAITKRITDAEANSVIAAICNTDTGCLKKILWEITPGIPITSLPQEKFNPTPAPHQFPLLCPEACNLLVAKARETVKKGPSEKPE